MKKKFLIAAIRFSLFLFACSFVASAFAAEPDLIAIGSISATFEDFAAETASPLENGIAGNRLGGMGSGLAYMGGDLFIGLPDRGPNAKPYASCLDAERQSPNRQCRESE